MPCKVFQIGVFFDGTDNSKDEKTTYSNVAKLHESYKILKDTPSFMGRITTTAKIYVTGIGTAKEGESGYMDDSNSSGTGYYGGHNDEGAAELAAGGGGAKRIYDAIDRICEELDNHPYAEDDSEKFCTRIIDVFGFSRGAAEARDFVNTFYLTIKDEEKYKDVSFNFIGIYDTVGSFGAAGNNINMKPKKEYIDEVSESDGWLWQNDHQEEDEYEKYNFHLSSASASKIIHLTAADEVRRNFPLTDLRDSGAQEIPMLGVHSDIGGGYESSIKEKLAIGTRGYSSKKQDLLMKSGWKFMAARRPSRYGSGITPESLNDHLYKVRKVDNSIATVSLHLMYKYAKTANVPFEDIKEKYSISGNIMDYYTHVMSTPANATGYVEASQIRSTYTHQSSTQPGTYLPYVLRVRNGLSEKRGIDSNVVNVVNNRPQRAVYANDSSSAISPKKG